MDSSSSTCESVSLSPVAVDRRVADRSLEWMQRQQRLGCQAAAGWTARHNLRMWNPWTNETQQATTAPVKRPRQSAGAPSCAEPATSVTKAAGNLYDMLLSQEMQQQERELQRQQLGAGSVISDSIVSSVPQQIRPRSNSNTNNKNPFGAGSANSGLRDVQRHQAAGGKRTTIITQFKTAETNQDGKVDINIIMDSESNMSNAPNSSDDQATTDADNSSKEADAAAAGAANGAGGGSSTDNDSATTGGGGVGAPGASTEDEEGGEGGQEPETPSTSAGEDGEADEGEGEGDADDAGEPADDLPAPGEEKKDSKTDKKKLNMGHLDKEGIVIGCMNVFADVSRKEYIVLLTDRVVEAFLVDPGQFRSIAKRTGCEIEVTRRILNRRIGMYRWVKYLVVTLRGPNLVAINQCDRLMVKMFPPYKIRKSYNETAQVALFVKESYPDNSDLYFNFQRTGPTVSRVGDLRLRSPFGKAPNRPIESTQWKQSNPRLQKGILEPRNLPMEISLEHVYPEWGSEKCSFMDTSCKWEQAGDLALEIEKKNNLERSLRVKQRKLGAEPLFAGGD